MYTYNLSSMSSGMALAQKFDGQKKINTYTKYIIQNLCRYLSNSQFLFNTTESKEAPPSAFLLYKVIIIYLKVNFLINRQVY